TEDGEVVETDDTDSENKTYSAIYSGNKTSLTAQSSGFYIGTNGIALGSYSKNEGCSPFQVSDAGVLRSRSGTIGGWTIGSSTLTAGNITLKSEGSMSGGSSYIWSINTSGSATFNNLTANGTGYIGGWVIGSTSNGVNYLRSSDGNVYLNSTGLLTGPTWSITSAGLASFNNIYVDGGEITLGGTTLRGNPTGTNLTDNVTSVTDKNGNTKILSLYVEDLSVGALKAASFELDNYQCKWQVVKVIGESEGGSFITYTRTYVPLSVVTGVSLNSDGSLQVTKEKSHDFMLNLS
ncbi:MAG: hypothetical protein LIO65_04165, partial [Odoribacter sp.]|nr:hypothetical protein [Odoribacter sp.]